MIVGVLLAAGAGTRFGGGKLLAPLPDGTPVGVRAARSLRAGVDRAIAVVRPEDVPLAAVLSSEGLEILAFPRADEGMGASLAFGVGQVPDASGWIVALADMPFVRPSTVGAVRRALENGDLVVAPSFRGRRGHPVGFGARLFDDLTRLSGDEGARALLVRLKNQVVLLECDDAGVLRDVDTVEDLSGQ
ncbi:MAG: nucleotidyltransferase family protein [Thermoanaerobaculia bacterium]